MFDLSWKMVFWGFVMVFPGCVCPGSTVISGETPA